MSRRFITPIESDVPNGTSPLVVDSSTLVTNLNADLLDGQHGSYYQNAGNLNAGTILAARMPALTGDITTTAGAVATTLSNTTVTAGSYGSATSVATFTVDSKGRLTAASNTNIAIAQSSVTNLTADLAAKASLSGATFTGTVVTPAATTSIPSIRLPHGTAPTSPTNGDIWTTTTGLFARINGSTVGPYGIGTARTFYQTTAPSTPATGDIWVDSDEVYTTINPNDYALKSDLPEAGFNPFFLGGM